MLSRQGGEVIVPIVFVATAVLNKLIRPIRSFRLVLTGGKVRAEPGAVFSVLVCWGSEVVEDPRSVSYPRTPGARVEGLWRNVLLATD
jgi:hypothetical protein